MRLVLTRVCGGIKFRPRPAPVSIFISSGTGPIVEKCHVQLKRFLEDVQGILEVVLYLFRPGGKVLLEKYGIKVEHYLNKAVWVVGKFIMVVFDTAKATPR